MGAEQFPEIGLRLPAEFEQRAQKFLFFPDEGFRRFVFFPAAENFSFVFADTGAEDRRSAAGGGKRMFHQAEQGDVVVRFFAAFGDQPEKNADGGLRQRPAGGIVDVYVPAPEFGSHAARQVAVGGDQGGGFFRRFQRVAHNCGNRQRFFAEFPATDQVNTVQSFCRKGLRGDFPPAVGGGGRPHGFRNQLFPSRSGRRYGIGNLFPRQAEIIKQLPDFVLGVRFVDQLPRMFVQAAVQIV